MIPRWFSRLSLLWKILLSTSVAILFAITGEIVLNHITKTMSDTLDEEVRESFQAYTSILQSRAELLSKVTRILSTMSDVRAAFSTGDQATIRDSAGELLFRQAGGRRGDRGEGQRDGRRNRGSGVGARQDG